MSRATAHTPYNAGVQSGFPMSAADLVGRDDALRALFVPFEQGALAWPAKGRALFAGARDGMPLHRWPTGHLLCQQHFKPFFDALERSGLQVGEPRPGEPFELVLLLPPRQRDACRARFAHALDHLAPGGTLLACVANHDGARTAQADLARLAGDVRQWSKYKCRVFCVQPGAGDVDADLQRQWKAMDELRTVADGLVSRPGLFAWDRIDTASGLLARCLPETLSGRVADLGAGAGYLSVQLVKRCARVTRIDLFEADARALPAARINVENACRQFGRELACGYHWHDVTTGVPGRFDHVVSNPPFHQGHANQPGLGRAFITAAAGALVAGGSFWMVANRHLAYEATLRRYFADVSAHMERDGFKVIEARR